jgi:hypothetical protein
LRKSPAVAAIRTFVSSPEGAGFWELQIRLILTVGSLNSAESNPTVPGKSVGWETIDIILGEFISRYLTRVFSLSVWSQFWILAFQIEVFGSFYTNLASDGREKRLI